MSKRESICNEIVSTLSALPSITYVTREPFQFEELSNAQFPAVLVQTGSESRSDITIGGSDITRQSTLSLELYGFVKGGNAIDTARNAIIEAIEEGLDVDRTRGGYALDTQVTAVDTDEGTIHPYGGVVLTVQVLYTFDRGNT